MIRVPKKSYKKAMVHRTPQEDKVSEAGMCKAERILAKLAKQAELNKTPNLKTGQPDARVSGGGGIKYPNDDHIPRPL